MNALQTRMQEGGFPVQVSIQAGSTFLTHLIGKLGFDSVLLDLQHGVFGVDRLNDLVMVLPPSAAPMVRVPSFDEGMIEKVLDTGVQGVVCPDVRSREQAEALVEICRWPRLGAEVMTIAQIETVAGMENVEAIASTAGLDALFPGPYDLAKAYGETPSLDYEAPAAVERLRRVVDVGHAFGLKVTLPTRSAAQTRRLVEWGVDWAMVGPDHAWLVAAARATLEETRKTAGA